MSAINVGEVYYFLRKHHSDELSESWRESSRTLPATIEVPTVDNCIRGCLRCGVGTEVQASIGDRRF